MKYTFKNSRFFCKWTFIVMLFLTILCCTDTAHAEDQESFDWFWMVYEKDFTQSYYSKTVYRPFYLNHIDKKGQFQASLMPVLFWRYKTPHNDQTHWLFGLGGSVDYTHSNGVKDYDMGFFPFFYYGDSKDSDDRYLLIWPFGGNLKQKFGYDEISAYAFPGFLLFFLYPPSTFFSWRTTFYVVLSLLPVYATADYKDYHAWSVMWPLIYSGESNKRSDYRILPFYAHNYKKGWYDNYSYLMIINYQKYFYRKDTHYTFFLFPLYGRKWSDSGDISATTILWPFFSWGYNKKHNDRSFNLPWPFVQIQDSEKPKIYKRIFFPFFCDYQYESNRTFFITPLHFTFEEKSETLQSKYNINGFIFWYFKRDYLTRAHNYYGNSWRYFKIWPLFNIECNDRGDYAFNFLSLLPTRDEIGYESLYQPFWSIVEYRRFQSGEKRFGLLFRTYYQRWGADYKDIKVPFIFSYKSRAHILTEFTILLSMFGYQHKKEGQYLKFIWIPIRIADADDKIKEYKETAIAKPLANYDYYCSLIDLANERSTMESGSQFNKVQVTYNLF